LVGYIDILYSSSALGNLSTSPRLLLVEARLIVTPLTTPEVIWYVNIVYVLVEAVNFGVSIVGAI
jgi:hypothetical protein